MFQRFSCGFYALYPSLACYVCSDVSEALLRILRTLSVSRLLKVCSGVSEALFLHCTVLHYIARLRFTFRWEGMAASTNCSSNVNCCATLRTYLVHREQRSTMTEERNSKTACSTKITTRHLADAHAPANGITHIRACAMDRAPALTYAHARWIARVDFFACFHAISLERSCFGHVNIHLLVVHNPLVPLIGRLVACSARTRADRQTTTVTLAAHARRGL